MIKIIIKLTGMIILVIRGSPEYSGTTKRQKING